MNHSAIICYILGCSVSTLVVFLMCMDFVMFIVAILIIVIHYFLLCYRNQLVGSGVEGLEAIGSPLPLRKRKSGITEVVHTKRRNSDSQHEATVGCNTVSPNSASSAGSTTKRRRVTSNSSNSEARDAVSVKNCDTKVGKYFQSYKGLTL